MACAIAGLAVHFVVFLHYAVAAVRYPFELFDAEGIVWQQAMLIPSWRMYGDINRFPFIVFHYPPVYHLTVRVMTTLGIDPLAAGRGISLVASLLIGALAASLTFRATRNDAGRLASLAGAATAGLSFFCFFPVIASTPLMRVDMLAIALSFLGVWCATRPANRPAQFYVAMALFVVAVFTKQTCIAAPLATLSVMTVANPRLGLKMLCFGLLLGGAAALVLTWATDGGFFRHVIFYNINRYSWLMAAQNLVSQSPHFLFISMALIGIVSFWGQRSRAGDLLTLSSFRRELALRDSPRLMAILTLYAGLSTCTLITLGKSGGGLSYFVEWMGILSVFIGILVATTTKHRMVQFRPPASRIALGLWLPAALIVQTLRLPASTDFDFSNLTQRHQLNDLVVRIHNATQPVLSDDMVLLMRAGKEVPWEPAIFTELASTGRWDEQRIIKLIDEHYFAFVITHGSAGRESSDLSFTPGVARAIRTAYPRMEESAEHTLRLPPE